MALHWASERYEEAGINLNPCLPVSLSLQPVSSMAPTWLFSLFIVGQLWVLCLSCPVVPLAQHTIYLGFTSDLS